MTNALVLVLGVATLAAAVVAVAVIARRFLPGANLTTLFAGKPAKRIDIVEQATIDGKRKLLLVRRDDVEHLVMIGGPVDLVIETGIDAHRRAGETRAVSLPPTRPPRPLGQAAE